MNVNMASCEGDMASCECKYLLQAGKGHKSQLMDCFENG